MDYEPEPEPGPEPPLNADKKPMPRALSSFTPPIAVTAPNYEEAPDA